MTQKFFNAKRIIRMLAIPVAVAGLFGSQAMAQSWEVGGLAGGSFYTGADVKGVADSGKVGFKNGYGFGGFIGNDMYSHVSGELRYMYYFSDLKVESGGQEATFTGRVNLIHYDFLLHLTDRESAIRPFVAGGGGVKQFRGTGKEVAAQPLSNLALLTRESEVQGVISVGGGVKVKVGDHVQFRVEVRDFISPFPKKVISPSINTKISGWLHDIVPMAGLSFLF